MSKKVIKISVMSCVACAAKIEKNLSKMDGVLKANVNLATEKANIEYDDKAVNT